MDVTTRLLDAVPAENLHVTRREFAAVWTDAEERAASPIGGDFVAGVVLTCRWIAGAAARSPVTNQMEMPRSPVHGRSAAAMPETIAAEYAAAVVEAAAVNPSDRAAYLRGLLATLDWVWNGSGNPPIAAVRTQPG